MAESIGLLPNGGTLGVPYEKDVEVWVRYLWEMWGDNVPEYVIQRIRSAPNMFEAREIAIEFHNQALRNGV